MRFYRLEEWLDEKLYKVGPWLRGLFWAVVVLYVVARAVQLWRLWLL